MMFFNKKIQAKISSQNNELFHVADNLSDLFSSCMSAFNSKKIILSDLAPDKRIALFFMARAGKTYKAIYALLKDGYSQDAAILLRTLVENLISLRYILNDPQSSSVKAVRFVEYKWVIFRRYIMNKKQGELDEHQALIISKFNEFKDKYNITSDKGLLTWSGRTIKDMASKVDDKLLAEYESMFRACSQFSHPSIISDREYVWYQSQALVFSTNPSSEGVSQNMKRAVNYFYEFIKIFDQMYELNKRNKIGELRKNMAKVFGMEKYNKALPFEKTSKSIDKESSKIPVKFNI